MAKRSGQSSILIDFLLVVIVTVTLLLSILTYFNIIDKKISVLQEVSNNSRYIAKALEEIGHKAINTGNITHFEEALSSISKMEGDTFYEIILYKVISENTLEIIYSTKKENIGKKAVLKNTTVEKEFKDIAVQEAEMFHEKIHTYDQINVIREGEKVIGTINIITSLTKIDEKNMRVLIINLVITVISIVIIIGLTTLMLLNRIYNPLKQLIEEVKRIKEGEVAYEVSIKVNNELSLLADEINEMKSAVWANNMDSRFANHITGLPTLIAAVESITDKIYGNIEFGIVSFSVRSYDGYILGYGINKWEEILRLFTNILYDKISAKKISNSTLAHIKDNQIMLIAATNAIEECANEIIAEFDDAIGMFYNAEDKDTGAIILKDSMGNDVIMPKLTMLAVVIKYPIIKEEVVNYKNVEEIITKMEIDYQELKESSRVVVYEKTADGKDELVKEVGEKVEENTEVERTKKEKQNDSRESEPEKMDLEDDLLGELKIE